MRVLVFDYEDRLRPVCTTPEKGSVGDCTDETQVVGTDVSSIIARYGGNLAEIARWRGSMSFGDQPPNNLEDALDALDNAQASLADLPNNPFKTLDEALAAFKDGTFFDRIKEEPVKEEPVKEVVNNEEKSSEAQGQ